jgi:hypothetical protein
VILDLESPKFSRHAGLDPASRSRNVLKRYWIPAFAGIPCLVMVIHSFGDYARFHPHQPDPGPGCDSPDT